MKPEAICFFDMDGTLLTSASTVSAKSLEALDMMRQNRVLPMIATGRTLIEIDHLMNETGIDSAVIMNGQAVIYQGEKVYQDVLEEELLGRLKVAADSQNVPLCFYNETKIRATQDGAALDKHFDYLGQPSPAVDPSLYLKEEINMALLLLESGDEYFPERFPELQFVRNTPFSNDVLRKNGSKAQGITAMLDVLGYQDVPTFAFGDGLNDLEMFQAVGCGVAMENAVPELKEKATFITKNNNEEGIYWGLKQAGLI
ncbi:Cof-type HAD-IIB family hydrolase [Listeria costaricensis]|uniref:Cof-type HAD-IIB family hydrolase n=1 Tax=Listeria costaricensis TaxID=2026604 RepID=UPI000C0856F1|nr:Cof-type HAD-IIB family hydrolase [Listeria costaricensis]